jgi:DNA-binding transcriptional MocR family regulator
MDENGIIPDELDSACRQRAPRAAYLIPTIHNPTRLCRCRAARRLPKSFAAMRC